jgi:hypothetical protein
MAEEYVTEAPQAGCVGMETECQNQVYGGEDLTSECWSGVMQR